jgi:glycosyltransferase involved in cell wall biosynthesis
MPTVVRLKQPHRGLQSLEAAPHQGGQVVAFRAGPLARKLKILHVSFSSTIGGSERYCADLANRQARLGHEVHVAGCFHSPVAAGLDPSVHFHPIDLPLFRAAQLDRLIVREGIEICHGHLSPASKALSRLKSNVPRLATLHVGYKTHQHSRLDGVICVNNNQAWRMGGYEGQSEVISNWLTAQSMTSARVDLRAELGLSPDTLLVGGIGRLHRSKGFDLLIPAFLDVAPAHAALVIVGAGPQRRALEKLAAGDPRIHFLGFRNDVGAILKGLDLFVSPSREESFGLAILEAMHVGLPVIATATDGPSEYMHDQPLTLVEPSSVGALTHALARQFYRPASRPSYDMRPFDPNLKVAQILAFYGQLGAGADRDNTQADEPAMLPHASFAQN